MSEKFVKGEELVHPERYTKNKIESWDFTMQSLLPHTIATVVEYVIRYKHKGGLQDLKKAINWAKKASQSYQYIRLCRPRELTRIEYFKSVPFVDETNFPDLSWEQLLILQHAQMLTFYLDNEEKFNSYIAKILESLEKLVEMEKEKEGSGNDFNEK